MNSVKTKKGTELPLIDLKGKKYLPVNYRIVWFREDHPFGRIDTECIERTPEYVIYSATISVVNDKGEYVKLADAVKREDIKHFPDNNEKAQTSSIGRALALCGYGTQFTDDLYEEERIVDAPIEPAKTKKEAKKERTLSQLKEFLVKNKLTDGQAIAVAHRRYGVAALSDLTGEQIYQVCLDLYEFVTVGKQ